MPGTAAAIREIVEGLDPQDTVEAGHRAHALAWLASTDDIFRRVKPMTPSPHLVCYTAVIDPRMDAVLLGDHRLAGRWLPPGGHVEAGEHPADTARRELVEELGLAPRFLDDRAVPRFLTWTTTVPPDSHVDVSLWYVMTASAAEPLTWDRGEFADVRWWTRDDLDGVPADRLDPHFDRFLSTVKRR